MFCEILGRYAQLQLVVDITPDIEYFSTGCEPLILTNNVMRGEKICTAAILQREYFVGQSRTSILK
jgi:hypothetical protein